MSHFLGRQAEGLAKEAEGHLEAAATIVKQQSADAAQSAVSAVGNFMGGFWDRIRNHDGSVSDEEDSDDDAATDASPCTACSSPHSRLNSPQSTRSLPRSRRTPRQRPRSEQPQLPPPLLGPWAQLVLPVGVPQARPGSAALLPLSEMAPVLLSGTRSMLSVPGTIRAPGPDALQLAPRATSFTVPRGPSFAVARAGSFAVPRAGSFAPPRVGSFAIGGPGRGCGAIESNWVLPPPGGAPVPRSATFPSLPAGWGASPQPHV